MPLPDPYERELIHTRTIICQGFHRSDGLWDIEAKLQDVRTYGVDNEYRGRIEAGEPVHNMSLRVTLDIEFRIHDIAASSDQVPAAACTTVTDGMKKLIGLRIASGWLQQVRERVGGVLGCTHLIEMLGPIGTTAYQTMYREVEAYNQDKPNGDKPRVIDSCVTWAASGDKVKKRWPAFYIEK
ncbi:MAG: DUF2889 domain-containing protein [Pseudomonadales bacterium]|nr:DUF2889 domain-containing protein [Pseudomonadales bacterium]